MEYGANTTFKLLFFDIIYVKNLMLKRIKTMQKPNLKLELGME
jgi:hypothetical protein